MPNNKQGTHIAADIAEKRLQRGRRIGQHFRNSLHSGLLAYAKGDKCVTLRAFNEAVTRFMLFLDSENAQEVDLTHIHSASAEVLEIALIAHSPCLTTVAQNLLPLHVEQRDPRSVYVRAVSFLILGDRDSATTEAAALVKLNSREFGKAIPVAILAITNGIPNVFLENVQAAMNDFDTLCATEARGTPEAVIFLSGVALIKLYERCNGEKILGTDLDVRLMPG